MNRRCAGVVLAIAVLAGGCRRSSPAGNEGAPGVSRPARPDDRERSESGRPTTAAGPSASADALAAGARHTCLLDSANRVLCWGANDSGQAGRPWRTDVLRPMPVVGLTDSSPVAVCAGSDFSCVLDADGRISCWGVRLPGSRVRGGPGFVPRVLGRDFRAMSCGGRAVCAVTQDQAVVCWGRLRNSERGAGTGREAASDSWKVAGVVGPVSVSVGASCACALGQDGGVSCWTGPGQEPKRLQGLPPARRLRVSGDTVCVLDSAGRPHCASCLRGGAETVGGLEGLVSLSVGKDGVCGVDREGRVACAGLSSQVAAWLGAVPQGKDFLQVAMGATHACALRRDGTVTCWGGLPLPGRDEKWSAKPVQVRGLPPAVVIFAGPGAACALDRKGRAWCWGQDSGYRLGGSLGEDGDLFRVQGVPALVGVALGGSHACGLVGDGRVFCWGEGLDGQLGREVVVDEEAGEALPDPGRVERLGEVLQVVATEEATCGLGADGRVRCWGSAEALRLEDSIRPRVRLRSKAPAFLVASEDAVCVVAEGGKTKCKGMDDQGELATLRLLHYRRRRGGPVGLAALALGEDHACGLGLDGRLWCWGSNGSGQLGAGLKPFRDEPVRVRKLSEVRQLAAGDEHTCALKADGRVVCWGASRQGQVGRRHLPYRTARPARVRGLPGPAVRIASGGAASCALTQDGGLWCWGKLNERIGPHPKQVEVPPGEAFRALCLGVFHGCLVASSGRLWCWGENDHGQLGPAGGKGAPRPVQVPGLEGVRSCSAGLDLSCALLEGKTVSCWGKGAVRLTGHAKQPGVPAPVPGVAEARGLSTLGARTCAVTAEGKVLCWGKDTAEKGSERPEVVAGLPKCRSVAVGGEHACALARDGRVWCWGDDSLGQLGDGSKRSRGPVRVPGLEGVVELVAGAFHTCARTEDGRVFCWGRADLGQVGDRRLAPSRAFVAVRIPEALRPRSRPGKTAARRP